MIDQVTSLLFQNFCLQIGGTTVELLHEAAQIMHVSRTDVSTYHTLVRHYVV